MKVAVWLYLSFIMQQQLFPKEAVGSFRRKSLTTSKCSESVSHDTYD